MPRYKKTSIAVVLLSAIFFNNNLVFAENVPKAIDVFNGSDVPQLPNLPQESEDSLGLVVSALRPHIEFSVTAKRDVFRNYVDEDTWEETTTSTATGEVPMPGPFGSTIGEPSTMILEEVEPPVKLPNLTVQGMIWDSNVPQAILNNKIFKIGDIIEGAKIITIDQTGVSLVFRKKTFKVKSSSFPKLKNPGNN